MNRLTKLVTGLLEADGMSTDSTAAKCRETLAHVLEGSSRWPRSLSDDSFDWAEYERRVGRPPARWTRPTGRAARRGDVAWFTRRLIDADVSEVRLEVDSVDDWTWLTREEFLLSRARSPHTLRVSAYVRHLAGRPWTWRWPLRVGVMRGPGPADIHAAGREQIGDLCTAVGGDPERPDTGRLWPCVGEVHAPSAVDDAIEVESGQAA
jgi:hypothetical protein